jgi:hypothetical protein
MVAWIYQPSKTAMQSGHALDKWVLKFDRAEKRETDPLMGWTSSGDTRAQVTLRFDTKEEAIAYAKRHGIPYRLREKPPRKRVKKSYADNFRYGRIGSWTH